MNGFGRTLDCQLESRRAIRLRLEHRSGRSESLHGRKRNPRAGSSSRALATRMTKSLSARESLDQLLQTNATLRHERETFEDRLSEIETSLGWLLIVANARACDCEVFPPGTLPGRVWTLASRFVKTAGTAGSRCALRKATRASGPEDREILARPPRVRNKVSRSGLPPARAGGSISASFPGSSWDTIGARPPDRPGISRFFWFRIPPAAPALRSACSGSRRSFREAARRRVLRRA